MTDEKAGYVECDGKSHRFESAVAYIADDGLTIEASGGDCQFSLQEYQFGWRSGFEYSQLIGKVFDAPDVNGAVPQLWLKSEEVRPRSFRLEVRAYDSSSAVMRVHVMLEDETRDRIYDIVLRCRTGF